VELPSAWPGDSKIILLQIASKMNVPLRKHGHIRLDYCLCKVVKLRFRVVYATRKTDSLPDALHGMRNRRSSMLLRLQGSRSPALERGRVEVNCKCNLWAE
jgi:hypothetical protein